MEEISGTETETSRGGKSREATGGKQDSFISIRLPSSLLQDIDRVSKENKQGRSELIRDILSGVLTISTGGFDEEQILRLQGAFVAFLRWANDPFESLLDILYKIIASIESPEFQKKSTLLMADSLIKLGGLMDAELRQTGTQSLVEIARMKGLNEEEIELMGHRLFDSIPPWRPAGVTIDDLKEMLDKDTEDGDEDDLDDKNEEEDDQDV